MPGLADMHHHLGSGSLRLQQNRQGNLGRLLSVGITTVFNPSISTTEFATLKAAATDDASAFARFFGTGPLVTVKGDTLGGAEGGLTPQDAAQAQEAVRQLKAAGVDAVKAMRDDFSWFSTQRLPLITPPEALRAATINAARMIDRDADLGSIAAGKRADLLILDANPLEDIRNIARMNRVMKGGVFHAPAGRPAPTAK